MKKILITGASGLLGSSICRLVSDKYETCGIYLTHPVVIPGVSGMGVDLTESGAMRNLKELNPDVIIHCAAMTNVDACECDPLTAYKHNVLATRNIVDLACQIDAYLIHISTESVFDGQTGFYKEDDEVNPLNIYAKTKRESECIVLEEAKKAAIVRTTIYGWSYTGRLSLAEWILGQLRKKNIVEGFKDAVFSPILTDDLAELLIDLCSLKAEGLFHVAGSEACSKLEFALQLADTFEIDKGLIMPKSISEFAFKAKRPMRVSLDVSRVEVVLNKKLPTIREGLMRFKELEHIYKKDKYDE